jgi:hypothetical protein
MAIHAHHWHGLGTVQPVSEPRKCLFGTKPWSAAGFAIGYECSHGSVMHQPTAWEARNSRPRVVPRAGACILIKSSACYVRNGMTDPPMKCWVKLLLNCAVEQEVRTCRYRENDIHTTGNTQHTLETSVQLKCTHQSVRNDRI